MLGSHPRDLNFTSYKCQMAYVLEAQEFPAYGSFSPWDVSFVTGQPGWDKMGTGQNSSPPAPTQCHPPRCETQDQLWQTPPRCRRASAGLAWGRSSVRLPPVALALWGWACLPAPGAAGAFPSDPLPATSPSSCPLVKQIWAATACPLVPRVHWPGSPKQEVHPEAQWPLWANWHLGQWGPGQRLHCPLQD